MTTIQVLKKKNPSIPFYSVFDWEFHRFGRIVDFDATALITACEQVAVMPSHGTRYVRSMPELEALPDFGTVKHLMRGESHCQIGICWGYNTMLNCLEYHRASEHNIAVSDMVLLLAAQQDMTGLDLPEGKVAAFFVPKGTTIEVYATTLHYCPCQCHDDGFRCIVVLPRGTNEPLDFPRPDCSDGPLLWAKDKWLIAHPENTAIMERGAYAGLQGENVCIQYEGRNNNAV